MDQSRLKAIRFEARCSKLLAPPCMTSSWTQVCVAGMMTHKADERPNPISAQKDVLVSDFRLASTRKTPVRPTPSVGNCMSNMEKNIWKTFRLFIGGDVLRYVPRCGICRGLFMGRRGGWSPTVHFETWNSDDCPGMVRRGRRQRTEHPG